MAVWVWRAAASVAVALALVPEAVAFAFVQYDRVQTLRDATADQAANLVALDEELDGAGADVAEALHRAGLEVFLDVVFNHTAEGDRLGSAQAPEPVFDWPPEAAPGAHALCFWRVWESARPEPGDEVALIGLVSGG